MDFTNKQLNVYYVVKSTIVRFMFTIFSILSLVLYYHKKKYLNETEILKCNDYCARERAI